MPLNVMFISIHYIIILLNFGEASPKPQLQESYKKPGFQFGIWALRLACKLLGVVTHIALTSLLAVPIAQSQGPPNCS